MSLTTKLTLEVCENAYKTVAASTSPSDFPILGVEI